MSNNRPLARTRPNTGTPTLTPLIDAIEDVLMHSTADVDKWLFYLNDDQWTRLVDAFVRI